MIKQSFKATHTSTLGKNNQITEISGNNVIYITLMLYNTLIHL